MPIDIIGDIHGHADALEALLTKLGYRRRDGAWRHPTHRALFLGDLIDRGPRQIDAIDIPRRMREAGGADILMANHEFNAVAFAMADWERPGRHYRPRNERNTRSHLVFLDAVESDSAAHREMVDFFMTLPLWGDFPEFRAIHACWCPEYLAALRPLVDAENRLTASGFRLTQVSGSKECKAVEVLLKGPEFQLPSGVTYLDHGGIERDRMRIKWWADGESTLRGMSNVEEEVAAAIPDTPFPEADKFRYVDPKPLFFGHYWMSGEPSVIAANKVCLDFSVASGGALCAYTFDGEAELDSENLTWVGGPEYEPVAAMRKA